MSVSLAVVEAALLAMRTAIVGASAPAGGWHVGEPDPQTVVWPWVDLQATWTQAPGTGEATVVETIHAKDRDEAVVLADLLVQSLRNRAYGAPAAGVRIVGHDLLAGPRVVRRLTSTTAELTWSVLIGWRP